ncbi:hypothetical protein LTR99_004856 [Exophiala xenobiotica]|uniref:Rhodopsin domain-containing protein n=1 Tax=Vermiconidia calcicola TaxID=1690605 RepID=A0AAV9QCG2_9PEZI|nr:hypothetical protein LTR96_008858 [Exophiala xenobiotica]KAK5540136.1 hypothetical protein LTR25_003841 [Vermiconidia calcicola]KAK5543227.1 hypothetical protein LTR23_004990 [Chaetothyriales sp. CCFEE 6169]KAK5304400.1 hypothetical protein LTR99_004856 [Exophiala xenobiotica]KAK5339008.1 hypothetical protein LTR98_005408 [Exophiala xenobiotica]
MAGVGAVACSLTFTILSVLLGGLRFFTRAYIVGALLIDDLLLGFAILASIALTTLIVFQSSNGLGEHMELLPIDEIYNFLKALWGSTIVYSIAMMLTQNVFLFQYRNFFQGLWLRRTTAAMVVLVTLFGIASTLSLAFQCVPMRYIWDPLSPEARCINYQVFWYISAGFNTLTAIVIWILPIPLIKGLHLPKRQKHWLVMVFALGVFTCLASGLRIRALNLGVKHSEFDTSYFYPEVAAWSSLEINVGIICACLPTLKPIVDKMFPGLLHDPARRPMGGSSANGNRNIYDRDGMYMGTMGSRAGRNVGVGGGGSVGAGQYKGGGSLGKTKTAETDLESLTTSSSWPPAKARAVLDF